MRLVPRVDVLHEAIRQTLSCSLQVAEAKVDGGCEQEHDFEIVRCTGHQHIGSRCITLYNADNGDKICQSCPVYGTELGETVCEGAAHAIGPVRGRVI